MGLDEVLAWEGTVAARKGSMALEGQVSEKCPEKSECKTEAKDRKRGKNAG